MSTGASDFRAAVRTQLATRMRGGAVGAPLVAADLGMSYQALQLRLRRRGTCYRALVNEVRRDLVVPHLLTGAPIAELALRVGFRSAGPFASWFRAQFGLSPNAWRMRQRRLSRFDGEAQVVAMSKP